MGVDPAGDALGELVDCEQVLHRLLLMVALYDERLMADAAFVAELRAASAVLGSSAHRLSMALARRGVFPRALGGGRRTGDDRKTGCDGGR